MVLNKCFLGCKMLTFSVVLMLNFRGLLPAGITEFLMLICCFYGLALNFKCISKENVFLTFILIMFSYSTLFSIYYAVNIIFVLTNFLYYLFGAVIVWSFLALIKDWTDLKYLMITYIVVTVIVGIVTFLQLILFYTAGSDSFMLYIRSGLARGAGFHGNPNYYSLSQLLSLSSALLLDSKYNNKFFKVLIFLSIVGIISSVSRGAILSGLIAYFIYLFINKRSKSLFFIVSIGSLFTLLLSIISNQALSRLIESRFSDGGGGAKDRFDSIIDGVNAVGDNLGMSVFGLGGNNFIFHSDYAPHNSYLRLFFENGILSFILFSLFILFVCFKKGWSGLRYAYFPIAFGLMALTNDIFILKEFWVAIAIYMLFIKLSPFCETLNENNS